MSDLFEANLQIIRSRWPEIGKRLDAVTADAMDALEPTLVEGKEQTIAVGGKQLSSRHARDSEAELLLSHLKDDQGPLNIFGMGLGDIPALAVRRWPGRQITLNLLSLPITAIVLHYTDQTHWLAADNLSIRLPVWTDVYQNSWTAIAPELQLADSEFARVRDHLQMELQRPFVDAQHQEAEEKAKPRIMEAIQLMQSMPDVATLFGQKHPRVIVVGAGPSLEQAYSWLNAQQNGAQPTFIIAADTAQKPLLINGITPDIVVTLDSKIGLEHLDIAHSQHSGLVCFPSSAPELIRSWQGATFRAITTSPTQKKYRSAQDFTPLFSGGSVIHPAMDLAVSCGAKEIFLCGCDFGYPNGKSLAFCQNGALGVASDQAGHRVENYLGESIPTTLNMRGYLLAAELFIKRHPEVRFYNLSEIGAKIEGCDFTETDTNHG